MRFLYHQDILHPGEFEQREEGYDEVEFRGAFFEELFESDNGLHPEPPEDLRDLRAFHKALADVNRLRIVRRLAEGEASVRELIAHVGLSQPLVSHHLKRLRAAGLIQSRRVGRETICSLRPEAFGEVAERERAILGLGVAS